MVPARRSQFSFRLGILAGLLALLPLSARSAQMDPLPFENFSQDDFAFSFYRYEKPSFYLLSCGLPDLFFNGITKLSDPTLTPGASLVYSLRDIEYGFQASAWPLDDVQLRLSLPFEAIAYEDLSDATRGRQTLGDLEVGATYLLVGNRRGGNTLGLDAWWRFATGTSPFTETVSPILATGKGVGEGSLGVVMRQQLGRFSLFESLHYQHSLPLRLGASTPVFGPGLFQWPDEVQALGRVEFLA
ncbi:MAG TPA: hypothetical protein VMU88_06480, partial [bacterium]|nr:hypothetical protein [bacterium]